MTKEKLYKKFNNSKGKIYETLKEAKDYICFILLSILIWLPLLRLLKPTAPYFVNGDYFLILYIGIIGVYLFIANLILKFYTSIDKKQYLKNYLPIFLLFLYLVWTLVSCSFAKNKETAFLGSSYRREGLVTYIAYAGIFGLSFSITSTKIKKNLLYTFTVISLTMIMLIQTANHFKLKNLVECMDISVASFSQFNHYGYYLLLSAAISSFLFISESKKILKIVNLLFYIVFLYFLILNDTFGCYLAFFGTLIVFVILALFKKQKKSLIFTIIAIFVILSIFVNKNSTQNVAKKNLESLVKDAHNINTSDTKWKQVGTGRGELWIYGLQFFSKRPILGYGAENLGPLYSELKIPQDRPHNILIQLATTSGLPGLMLYCTAIRNYIIQKFQKI